MSFCYATKLRILQRIREVELGEIAEMHLVPAKAEVGQ